MKKMIFLMMGFFLPTAAHAAEFTIIPQEMFDIFRTGDFTWIDIINFLLHIIQLLLSLAAVLAIILIMYGGFQMVFGSIVDDKESGKKTIQFSIIGLIVTLSAWIMVDILVSFLTNAA